MSRMHKDVTNIVKYDRRHPSDRRSETTSPVSHLSEQFIAGLTRPARFNLIQIDFIFFSALETSEERIKVTVF